MSPAAKFYGGSGQGFEGHSGYFRADGRPNVNPAGRNKRTVWTVATKPFKGAHFATFPPDLIKPMILAGCPPNGVVLDMFLGSGTTAYVAQRLGRRWIGCDINAEYVEIARERLSESYSLPLFEASPITDIDAGQPEDHLTSENPK